MIRVGEIVYDWALGKNGIVVGSEFTERCDIMYESSRPVHWEWCVLYEDGELMGADTNDLKVIKDEV